jgi:hypothetical protein
MLALLGWTGIAINVLLFSLMGGMREAGIVMYVPIALATICSVVLFLSGILFAQARRWCLAGLLFYLLVIGYFSIHV